MRTLSKPDYTPAVRSMEEVIRTFHLPVIAGTYLPHLNVVSLSIFGDRKSLEEYREDFGTQYPSEEAPRGPVIDSFLIYRRKQRFLNEWLRTPSTRELRFPGNVSKISEISYGLYRKGRGLVSASLNLDGTLKSVSMSTDLSEILFHHLTQLFGDNNAEVKWDGNHYEIDFNSSFEQAILLRFLLERLEEGAVQ